MKRHRDRNGRFVNEKNYSQRLNGKVVIAAIICLTVLEIAAMYFGINGKIFSLILFLIGSLAGLVIPPPKILSRN